MAHPGGRPTKYKPEYCQALVNHMASGLSFQSFAAEVDVNEDTLYAWEEAHPQFSDAKKTGFVKSRSFWEKKMLEGVFTGKDERFNATIAIFNMKNRFPKEWRERHEIEHSGKVTLEDFVGGSNDQRPTQT